MKLLILAGVLLVLVGCSHRDYPPAKTEWISITKPPFKVTYVAQEKLDPVVVTKIIAESRRHGYQNYKFNETDVVSINSSHIKTDTESDIDSKTTSRNR